MEMVVPLPKDMGGIGMAPKNFGQGSRKSGQQREFRQGLIEACGSFVAQMSESTFLYCPITRSICRANVMKAAHIFPYGAGPALMAAMFQGANEAPISLFDLNNGLMMCAEAETRIGMGLMALEPDFAVDVDEETRGRWRKDPLKQYIIRVYQPNHPKMTSNIPWVWLRHNVEKKWSALDGCLVDFRTNHRPRSRYLYWQSCVALLSTVYSRPNGGALESIEPRIKKSSWAIVGPWARPSFVKAMIGEVGQNVAEASGLTDIAAGAGVSEAGDFQGLDSLSAQDIALGAIEAMSMQILGEYSLAHPSERIRDPDGSESDSDLGDSEEEGGEEEGEEEEEEEEDDDGKRDA